MVFHDRPVYQEEHAAQLIMARSLHSPHKGRIHLRRSVDPLFAFPLQSDGGPYIFGNSLSYIVKMSGIAIHLAHNLDHHYTYPASAEHRSESSRQFRYSRRREKSVAGCSAFVSVAALYDQDTCRS